MTYGFDFDPERASPAPTFFLVVIDCDTERFTLEGPSVNWAAWEAELRRVCNAGRDIRSFAVEAQAIEAMTGWLKGAGYDEWPARSIVDLPSGVGPRDLKDTAIRASGPVNSAPQQRSQQA